MDADRSNAGSMPSQNNIKQLETLRKKLDSSRGALLVDYTGLESRQMEMLRNTIEESGGSLHVVKNTLLAIVLQKPMSEHLTKDGELFKNTTAVVYLGDDVIAPIKILTEYIKANEKPSIKGGILDDSYITVDEVQTLATLPPYEVLISRIIGQIQAPIAGITRTIQGPIRKLVYALGQIQTTKGGE